MEFHIVSRSKLCDCNEAKDIPATRGLYALGMGRTNRLGSFPMPGDAVSAHRRWQDGMKSDHPGQRARVLRGRQHLTMTEGIPGFVAQEQRKAEQVCLPIHSARLRPTAPQYEEVLRFDARMSRSAV